MDRPALPADYDDDPGRRAANRATRPFQTAGDVHEPVATRLVAEGLLPVLDVGSGEGELARFVAAGGWIGVEQSPAQLERCAPRPVLRANAVALPLPDASVPAVVALWMLYHLDDPAAAVAEAARVLRPGGLFACCTTSRDDSPELAFAVGRPPTSFDAEEAPAIVASVFGEDAVEVERWDAPMLVLPDREAVSNYLRGRTVPAERARAAAEEVDVPLTVTKRGAVVWARR